MTIKQNVQKQVVDLLSQLPESTQIELALDFVSHAIIDFPDEYYNPQKLFELICNYVQGKSPFSEVFEEYEKVHWVESYNSTYHFSFNAFRVTENDPIYIWKKYGLLFGLFDLCCYEGLKEYYFRTKGISWPKPYWNVADVSWHAAFVKALSFVGDDWNSKDPYLHQQARQEGHKISQKEKLWQIQQIQSRLNNEIQKNYTPE